MKLAEGYLIKEIAGSYALIPIGQNVVDAKNILSTNETGFFILQQLKNEISVNDLFHAICEEYEATEDEWQQITTDMLSFLSALREKKLLCE